MGGLCCWASAAEPLTDHQRHVENAGTVVQYAVPAGALLATWLLAPREDAAAPGDAGPRYLLMGGSPRHDLALAMGRAWLVTEALKHAVDETRPNGGRYSFPSGHASFAFSGAEFIRNEYGWQWGVPAYAAASFVAWSRVEARKHYTHDVLAGAAVGIVANHDFWRHHTSNSDMRVTATAMAGTTRLVPGLQFELVR
jgi:hypothetical protein